MRKPRILLTLVPLFEKVSRVVPWNLRSSVLIQEDSPVSVSATWIVSLVGRKLHFPTMFFTDRTSPSIVSDWGTVLPVCLLLKLLWLVCPGEFVFSGTQNDSNSIASVGAPSTLFSSWRKVCLYFLLIEPVRLVSLIQGGLDWQIRRAKVCEKQRNLAVSCSGCCLQFSNVL